jgi:ABC-type Zn uptake system ZnuABC Zn-binding protein ZnuA
MRRLLLFWIFCIFLLTSCGRSSASPSGTPFDSTQGRFAPVILTSTTILADIARRVAGNRVTVESLLPVGADPHSYQPTPQDAAKIAQCKLLIVNGAGFERFLDRLLQNAGGDERVIEASAGINPRKDAQGDSDPHLWLDPDHVVTYVENIRQALTEFDPGGAAIYHSNAEAYTRQLTDLDEWIKAQVSQIPPERKLLITNHESLGYFAERYGFTIVGALIQSFSADASPSAQQMASLVDQIKASGASAIFLDAADNAMLARQIADETGARVVTDLHLESLTDGAPAGTYIELMKHNVTQIVNALK